MTMEMMLPMCGSLVIAEAQESLIREHIQSQGEKTEPCNMCSAKKNKDTRPAEIAWNCIIYYFSVGLGLQVAPEKC